MIREKVEVPFFAQIRVDSVCKDGKVDQELLDLLWNAGCRIVYLGLESVNPATLKEYHKESSIDDMAGGLEALANRGIKTHGMFVFGADSDTAESLHHTADFATQHGLNSVQFLALTPLPGTRQTAQFEAEGRIFTKNWSLYDGHHVVFWPKQMTPYELQEVMLQAHKRFYKARRIVTIKPKAPMYHKHQIAGISDQPGLGARAREPRFHAGAQGFLRVAGAPGVGGSRLSQVGFRDGHPVVSPLRCRRRDEPALAAARSVATEDSARLFRKAIIVDFRNRYLTKGSTFGQSRGLRESEGRRGEDHDHPQSGCGLPGAGPPRAGRGHGPPGQSHHEPGAQPGLGAAEHVRRAGQRGEHRGGALPSGARRGGVEHRSGRGRDRAQLADRKRDER